MTTLADATAVPAGVGVVSWLDLPTHEPTALAVLTELIRWMEVVYLRYADAARGLPECWLWHPDVVEELLWLMHAWLAAYHDDTAPASLAADWHDRYRPGAVKRINTTAGRCSLEAHQPRDTDTEPDDNGAPGGAAGQRDGPDRRVVGHPPQRSRTAPRPDAARDRSNPAPTRDPTMTTPVPTPHQPAEPNGWARWTVWLAGLAVALGAGVATAHGLYEVALAAGTPRALAWLYPLITDGLALVAYATTARLADHGRRYAWTVVVAAAGLSGLTQASYLAGGVATAPPALRFAIGAWPAIAAAIVAHLLFLLGTHNQPPTTKPDLTAGGPLPVATTPADPVPPARPPLPQAVTSSSTALPQPTRRAAPAAVQPDLAGLYNPPPSEQPIEHPEITASLPVVQASAARDAAPARVRAHTAATGHATQHGALPTVTELMALAQVARGTAAAALKDLRKQPTQPSQVEITSSTSEQKASR